MQILESDTCSLSCGVLYVKSVSVSDHFIGYPVHDMSPT